MDLSWLQSILYGLVSGLMDILPVSAQAHKALLLKFMGKQGHSDLLELLIHLGIFAALYYNSQAMLIRMRRARKLARIPKRKRKRPLDIRSMMDWRMLMTMVIPVILGIFLYQYTQDIQNNFVCIAVFLFLNGIVLYAPQFFPTGNRDSRTLSRVEGLLMGLGGTAYILPGVSSIGTATSIGSVCGVERSYGLNMALMMHMFLTLGMAGYDILGIVNSGINGLSFLLVLRYALAALSAFCGTTAAIRIMRHLAAEKGYAFFGIYCWGMALFTFILNLIA